MSYLPIAVRDGNNAAQNMGAFQDASLVNYSAVMMDSTRPTYRVAANFTPQPTGAVTLISIQGSASKTIRIKRILVQGSITGGVASTLFGLQRTSALGAGGTTVSPTVAKMDTLSATASAVVSHYTTTLKAAGTPVGGPLSTIQLFSTTAVTPTVAWADGQMMFPEKGAPIGQALVLRGVADFVEVQNLNAGNLGTNQTISYMVEWEEDAS